MSSGLKMCEGQAVAPTLVAAACPSILESCEYSSVRVQAAVAGGVGRDRCDRPSSTGAERHTGSKHCHAGP